MPPEHPANNRRIIAHLTFTSLLTALVVIGAAITAAYVFGVMTGRHYVADKPVAVYAEAAPRQEDEEDAKDRKILRPQDLEYVQILRGEKKRTVPSAPPAASSPGLPDSGTVAQKESALPEQPAPDGMFDYVFQMAALRDAASADQLREELEGKGLRTRLERSGKVLLVLVPLRGDAERAAEVEAIAQGLRLGKPLLRSRKPVGG